MACPGVAQLAVRQVAASGRGRHHNQPGKRIHTRVRKTLYYYAATVQMQPETDGFFFLKKKKKKKQKQTEMLIYSTEYSVLLLATSVVRSFILYC